MRYLMRRSAAASVVLGLAIAATSAGASARPAVFGLDGNVAPWTQDAVPLARAPKGSVGVSVYLRLRGEPALKKLVARVNDPGSPAYGKFLTPAQFRARFSPPLREVRAVRAFLAAQGLRVLHVPANRTYVSAVGSVGSVERAFGVKRAAVPATAGLTLRGTADPPTFLARWQRASATWAVSTRQTGSCARPPGHPESRASGRRPLRAWLCDAGAVLDVLGRPRSDRDAARVPVRVDAAVDAVRIHAAADPGRLRRRPDEPDRGRDHVGITDAFASPTIVQDVNRFSAHYGLPLLNDDQLPADRRPGTSNFPENRFDPQGWFGEETLDVEWVHAMAPRRRSSSPAARIRPSRSIMR